MSSCVHARRLRAGGWADLSLAQTACQQAASCSSPWALQVEVVRRQSSEGPACQPSACCIGSSRGCTVCLAAQALSLQGMTAQEASSPSEGATVITPLPLPVMLAQGKLPATPTLPDLHVKVQPVRGTFNPSGKVAITGEQAGR